MSKFRYHILPKETYVITINGQTFEMLGQDILDILWKSLDDGK